MEKGGINIDSGRVHTALFGQHRQIFLILGMLHVSFNVATPIGLLCDGSRSGVAHSSSCVYDCELF